MKSSEKPTPPVFIGRKDELQRLSQELDAAMHERQTRFVLLEGDVGAGKTALIYRFLDGQQSEAIVAHGRCAPETELSGLVPFNGLLLRMAEQVLPQKRSDAGGAQADDESRARCTRLRKNLVEVFSESELDVLCYDMNLDYENLPGEGKDRKAKELVAYLERRGRVPELIDRCNLERPNVQWEDMREGGTVINFLRDVAPAWSAIIAADMAHAAGKAVEVDAELHEERSFTQEQVFIQYTNALQRLAEICPLLAVTDDLHWADASSLKLLSHLARNLRDARVLFIGAYRPYEASQRGVKASLFTEICAHPIKLTGLKVSEYAAGRYWPNRFPPQIVQDIEDRTGGNALFLNELFSSWEQRGILRKVEDPDQRWVWELSAQGEVPYAIPSGLSEVLSDRWCGIHENLQRILRYAAVEGEDFTAQIVAHVPGADELATYEGLKVLEQSYRLIQQKARLESDSSVFDIFKFSQRFFREHICSNQLNAPLHRLLHKQVGECLESLFADRPEVAGRLVRHFCEADEPFKCAEYALAAARFEQSRFAWSAGEQLCELGLRMTYRIRPEQAARQLRLDLLQQSGYGFHERGEYARSHERYNEALQVARGLGASAKCIATLLDSLGDVCDYEGQLGQAWAHYAEAREILEAHSEPFSEAHLSIEAGLAYIQDRQGKTEQSVEIYQQLLAAAEHLPYTLQLRINQGWVYNYLGIALGNLGRYSESSPAFRRAIEIARETGCPRLEVTCILNQADDYLKAGLLDESLALGDVGLERARKLGDVDNESYALDNRAAVLLARNEPREALTIVQKAISITEQPVSQWDVPFMYAHSAQAHQMLGDIDAAYQESLRAVECGRQVSYQLELGCLLDLLAQIEAARGDWEQAQQHFAEAIGLLAGGKYRHMEARTKRHLASELTHRGDRLKAIGLLREALAALNELHLKEEADKTAAFLAGLESGQEV